MTFVFQSFIMKNSTLLFRSLLIVAIIGGVPHALAIYAESKVHSEVNPSYQTVPSLSIPNQETEQTNKPEKQPDWAYYWKGRYEVTFEGIEEKSIYEIREEQNVLRCYSIAYIDASGNRYKDETLLMPSLHIDEYKAEADYKIEYDGTEYKVKSKLQMDEDGNIWLNYEYSGYEGSESWKRIQ
jgi:hypothetical protein